MTPADRAVEAALNAYHGRERKWDDERKDQMRRALAAAEAVYEAEGYRRTPPADGDAK